MPEIMNEITGEDDKKGLMLNWLNREHNQTYQRLIKSFDVDNADRIVILHHIMKYDYIVFQSWINIINNNQTTVNEDWCIAWHTLMEE
tara:strand:- start:50 stop:313 length:264 start_codon:yes stop_codon:yes gene_type:complete